MTSRYFMLISLSGKRRLSHLTGLHVVVALPQGNDIDHAFIGYISSQDALQAHLHAQPAAYLSWQLNSLASVMAPKKVKGMNGFVAETRPICDDNPKGIKRLVTTQLT